MLCWIVAKRCKLNKSIPYRSYTLLAKISSVKAHRDRILSEPTRHVFAFKFNGIYTMGSVMLVSHHTYRGLHYGSRRILFETKANYRHGGY